MKKRLETVVIAVAALLLAGCAIPSSYEATSRSASEGAVVSGWMQLFPLLKVVVLGVDGHVRRGWDAHSPSPLLVDPGMRVLEIRGEYLGILHTGYANVELTADLQAGHAYQLSIEKDGQLLTFCLKDETIGNSVSECQTKEARIRPFWGG